MSTQNDCLAFIDAANLMYGGKKSLGWSIDHEKLISYLKTKYKISRAHYYAGVDTCDYPYTPIDKTDIDLNELFVYLESQLLLSTNKQQQENITKSLQQVKFYRKLMSFGYVLHLKPVKIFHNETKTVKKANCDVDMTFDLMRLEPKYQQAIILSGDGDFFIVLKYLQQEKQKTIHIMARAERTARELRQLAGGKFIDFVKLKNALEYKEKTLGQKKGADIRNIRSTFVKRNISHKKRSVK